MTVRTILTYPHPLLRQQAEAVATFDDGLRALADDMLETMYQAGGIGLAAPQIGVSQRVVVVDLGEEKPAPEVFVNPSYRILQQAEPVMIAEGCLSVPRLRVEVERFSAIEFNWQDLSGEQHQECPDDSLRCICLQHELDHLDGRLLVDYLSRMQREKYKRLLHKSPERAEEMTVAANRQPGEPLPDAAAAQTYAAIAKSRGREEYERKVSA